MNDLIDKVALIDALAKRVPYAIDTSDEVAFAQGLDAAYQCVVDAPSIPAEVVRHGRWEQMGERPGLVFFTCTACGWSHEKSLWNPLEKTRNYCPNCGCCMDGKEDSR
jgi:hypothetical protein